MGLFQSLTGKKELNPMWTRIESEEDFAGALKESKTHPILIFKHSTRCPISRMMLSTFEKGIAEHPAKDYNFYYLDLLKFRKVSNRIAEQFEVEHQSPQILVVREGKCIYNTSHAAISAETLPETE